MLVALVLILAVLGFLVFLQNKPKPQDNSNLLLQQQINALQEQLRLSLEGSSGQIAQRLDNAARIVGDLSNKMVRVEEATKQVLEVGKDMSSLQQLLKAPKLRGNLGEFLLADLLAQMLPREHFELQYGFNNGERVDAVIRMAQGLVPVDAKFPIESFQRLAEASTEDEKKPLRKLFTTNVKKHIDDIAAKYILPAEGTFEFALMYIPAENVFYEIMTRDAALGDNWDLTAYAMKKRVIPVSPNSFYAYLHTILLGLKGLQVEKRAREILDEMHRLQGDIGKFHEKFGKIGFHLSNASKAYEESDKSLVRLEEKLGTLEREPAKTDYTLPQPPPIEGGGKTSIPSPLVGEGQGEGGPS